MSAAPDAPVFNTLGPGDLFPRVTQRSGNGRDFATDAAAGRYLVFCFFGSLNDPMGLSALEAARRHRDILDDNRACLFGVSVDPQDEATGRIADSIPGIRVLWDFDQRASQACGIVPAQAGTSNGRRVFRRSWIIVDPTLHVLQSFSFEDSGPEHERVFAYLKALPPPHRYAGFEIPAPVLVLPNVLEPDLCGRLIALYDAKGGGESGVMRGGKAVLDDSFKRRKDCTIGDRELCDLLWQRVLRRVVPEIRRLFFLDITRMERYIVGCYAAEDGGHFSPHRDNNPGVTAHRRFAVSINLNGEFEGGAVRFPEYNPRGIKAPPGWAVVFPAAILHAVSQVSSGRRYAFLPFVYDEAGARIRQAGLRQAAPPDGEAPQPALTGGRA